MSGLEPLSAAEQFEAALMNVYREAQAAFGLPQKPLYGQPCNGCGLCCITEQCPSSIELFGAHALCPAIEMEGSKIRCGVMANPIRYLPESVAPAAARYMTVVQGVGFGCDAVTSVFDEMAEMIEDNRHKAHGAKQKVFLDEARIELLEAVLLDGIENSHA